MLHSIQPRYSGQGDHRIGRGGLRQLGKKLLLLRVGRDFRAQPSLPAKALGLGDIGSALLLLFCQYCNTVHCKAPFLLCLPLL